MLTGCQSEVALDGVGTRKTRDVVDGRDETHTGDNTNSWNRHQSLADGIFSCQLLELLVSFQDLLLDRFNAGEYALNVLGKALGMLGCGVSNAFGQSRGNPRREFQKQATSPATQLIRAVRT